MTDPSPPVLAFLIIFLPGIFYAAKTLTFRVLNNESSSIHTYSMATGLWLLCVHISGLLLKDFYLGLTLGTLIPGGTGYLLRYYTAIPARKDSSITRTQILIATMGLLFFSKAIIFSDFHDKLGSYMSHFAISGQILNGIYPPRDMSFATEPIRYHYGVDTLFAMIAAIFRVRIDVAVDITTAGLWFLTLLLFGQICAGLFGESARIPGTLIPAFSGGIPWIIKPGERIDQLLLGYYQVGEQYVNPPLASYFFQHPWTIGVPIGLSLTSLILYITSTTKQKWIFVAPAFLILALTLAVSQVVLFLTILGSAAALFVFHAWKGQSFKEKVTRFLSPFSLIILSVLCSMLLSGFTNVVDQEGKQSSLVFAPGGIAGEPADSLIWNIASMGLPILLGIYGFLRVKTARWFFLIFIAGCIGAANLFVYRYSWDIVKFITAAQVMLGIGSTGALLVLWKRSRVITVLATIIVVASGVSYHIYPWLVPSERLAKNNTYDNSVAHSKLSSDDFSVIHYLRTKIQPGELVLRSEPMALGYAIFGGIPQFATDPNTYAFGFPKRKVRKRERLLLKPPESPKKLLKEGVKWVVVDKQSETDPYLLTMKQWKKQQLVREEFKTSTLLVYNLFNSESKGSTMEY